MDLLRLGLERGKTAYEAMHVIIELLGKYGQSGDCERDGEWGKANYHNSFILADPQRGLGPGNRGQILGGQKITHGVYSISNIYSIEKDWDEAHPKLVEHAIEMGWTKSAQSFNFARDYGDYWEKDSKDPGGMQIRRNMTLACLRKDIKQITPAIMMKISRSHLEGTIAESRWSPRRAFGPLLACTTPAASRTTARRPWWRTFGLRCLHFCARFTGRASPILAAMFSSPSIFMAPGFP